MENLNISYRHYHEQFMSNHTGCSFLEVLYFVTPFPAYFYIVNYINAVIFHQKVITLSTYIIEFLLLILPMILSCTLLNDYGLYFLIIPNCLILMNFFYHLTKCTKKFMKMALNILVPVKQRDYLTYFRASINLITAFCILAVDFKIFPRKFAKTETFGFSLMDTGVGFYIFSNGLVFKLNETRNPFIKSILSSLPLFLLGIIRTLSLQNLNYQQHITEYGLFWNFFFTLAFVKIFSSILLYYGPNKKYLLPLIIIFIHQLELNYGLQDWLLNENLRENIFTANKEGIFSLPGYISIYLIAVCIGGYLNEKLVDIYKDLRNCLKLFICFIIFLLLTLYLYTKYDISRQSVNVTYILWILTLSFILLSLSLFSEILLRITFLMFNIKYPLTPYILNSINYNGLIFFLLSNLLTGIINIKLETLFIDTIHSLLLLMLYLFILCSFITFLYVHKIKIKSW